MVKWTGIGTPLEIDKSSRDPHVQIIWSDHESAVESRGHGAKLPKFLITRGNLLKQECVARIQFKRSLQAAGGFGPETLTAIDIASQLVDFGLFGKSARSSASSARALL